LNLEILSVQAEIIINLTKFHILTNTLPEAGFAVDFFVTQNII